jgi:hypothetical protein
MQTRTVSGDQILHDIAVSLKDKTVLEEDLVSPESRIEKPTDFPDSAASTRLQRNGKTLQLRFTDGLL